NPSSSTHYWGPRDQDSLFLIPRASARLDTHVGGHPICSSSNGSRRKDRQARVDTCDVGCSPKRYEFALNPRPHTSFVPLQAGTARATCEEAFRPLPLR